MECCQGTSDSRDSARTERPHNHSPASSPNLHFGRRVSVPRPLQLHTQEVICLGESSHFCTSN